MPEGRDTESRPGHLPRPESHLPRGATPAFPDEDVFSDVSETELAHIEAEARRTIAARQVARHVLEARLRGKDAELNVLMDGLVPPDAAHARQRNAAFAAIARSDLAGGGTERSGEGTGRSGEGTERSGEGTGRSGDAAAEVVGEIRMERPRCHIDIDYEYVEELDDLLRRYETHCAGRRPDLPPVSQLGLHEDALHTGDNGMLRPTPQGWDDASRLREEIRNKLNEVMPDGACFDHARQKIVDTVQAGGGRVRGEWRSGHYAVVFAATRTQLRIHRALEAERPADPEPEVAAGLARAIAQGMRERGEMLARGRAEGLGHALSPENGDGERTLADRLPAGTLAEEDPAERARIRAHPISLHRDTSLVEALWSEGPPRPHPLLQIPDGCVPLAEPVPDSEPDPIPEPPGGFRSAAARAGSSPPESSPFQNAQPRSPLPELSDFELEPTPSSTASRAPFAPEPPPSRLSPALAPAFSQVASPERLQGSGRVGSSAATLSAAAQGSPSRSQSPSTERGAASSPRFGAGSQSLAPSGSDDDSSFQPAQRRDWLEFISDSQPDIDLSPASMPTPASGSSAAHPRNLRERSRSLSREASAEAGGQGLGKRTRDAALAVEGAESSPDPDADQRPARRPRLDDRSGGFAR
ncbi:hypothetical protein [Breoghania sp. JC706]|uniref:hypothetical protein n=1 Tax=Breoghania sp. JC706 TaxID=3117732 RepID=UPI00300A015E